MNIAISRSLLLHAAAVAVVMLLDSAAAGVLYTFSY